MQADTIAPMKLSAPQSTNVTMSGQTPLGKLMAEERKKLEQAQAMQHTAILSNPVQSQLVTQSQPIQYKNVDSSQIAKQMAVNQTRSTVTPTTNANQTGNEIRSASYVPNTSNKNVTNEQLELIGKYSANMK